MGPEPSLPPSSPVLPDSASPRPVPDPFGPRRWLVGTAIVVAVTASQLIPHVLMGHPREHLVARLLFLGLATPALMLSLSLHYVWASRRGYGSARMVLTSLALAVSMGALCSLSMRLVIKDFPMPRFAAGHPLSLAEVAAFGGVMGIFQCGVWALAFVYPFAVEDARLGALEAQKLRLEAAQLRSAAELARLRSQLEPHFLLNTLNAIAGLVTQDAKEARRLIACLGDLLRDSLRDPGETQTLEEEIAWLRRYAEILESRHSGALRFQWEISGEAGAVRLPRLLLQPLVENAVKHGALRRAGGGQVTVRAHVEPGQGGSVSRVVCTVEDNGPGMPEGAPRSGAFGLRAVRRRLELWYEGASLRLETSGTGTRSIVELPRLVSSGERSAPAGAS